MSAGFKHGFGLSVAVTGSSRMGGVMFGSSKDHFWSNRIDFDGLASFLRRLYPSKTAACVAADTGLPADSVKKWLLGEVQPNGRAMLALICAYGPPLICAAVKSPPEWCDAGLRAAKIAKLRAELDALEKQ
jgi:hypothetical protein